LANNNNNKKPRVYLKNKDLYAAVVESKEAGRMSDKLARMLQLLTERIGRKANYIGYSFNEDMQSYAMMMLVRNWSKFDHEKYTNAFAYYTQLIDSSFKQFLNKEKRQRDVRDILLVKGGLAPSFRYQEEHKSAGTYEELREDEAIQHGEERQEDRSKDSR
jgi:DNA-directed RNA polymerase specialized sigma subunit